MPPNNTNTSQIDAIKAVIEQIARRYFICNMALLGNKEARKLFNANELPRKAKKKLYGAK